MKKRIIACFLILAMGIMGVALTAVAERIEPTRVINLVFDDSGSMYWSGSSRNPTFDNDSWSQVGYALEVFVSMLGPNDRMNIYLMSEFGFGPDGMTTRPDGMTAGPYMELCGSDGMVVNVRDIHQRDLTHGWTPFNTVRRAMYDLRNEDADQKWLVVFTDGMFQDGDEQGDGVYVAPHYLEAFFAGKDDDIYVMFFSMGHVWPEAATITPNHDQNIFFKQTKTNTDILLMVTDMCQRIFNLNRLDVNVNTNEFVFDVPMSELIVFAQGPEVVLEGMRSPDGELIHSDEYTSVSYREPQHDFRHPDAMVARNLVGIVARFEGDFSPGEYLLYIEGAETIEIYYRPNVDIVAYLTNHEGVVFAHTDRLETGEYIINFGFVRGGTNERVPHSELLGDVRYEAMVTINGVRHDRIYQQGDTIFIEEGIVVIDVEAHFLEFNFVSARLEHEVIVQRLLTFEILENPEYYLEVTGFENGDQPIVLLLLLDGEEFSAEQWAALDVPRVTSPDSRVGSFRVEKSSTPGTLYLYPTLYLATPLMQRTGNIQLQINHEQSVEYEIWRGTKEIPAHIVDGIPLWIRYTVPFVICVVFLFLLLMILLFFMKRVLPKDINRDANSMAFTIWPEGEIIEGVTPQTPYSRKGKTLKVQTPKISNPAAEGTVTFTLKPVDRRYVKSRKRHVIIKNIHATGNVYEIRINGKTYHKHPRHNNKWMEEAFINEEGDVRPIEQKVRNFQIEIALGTVEDTKSTLECRVIHR